MVDNSGPFGVMKLSSKSDSLPMEISIGNAELRLRVSRKTGMLQVLLKDHL